MKSDAGVPVAYAMHAFPERFTQFLGAGVSVVADLPAARNTARNRIFAIAEGWPESSRVQPSVAQIPRDVRTCGVSVALDGVRAKINECQTTVGYGGVTNGRH